MEMAIRLLRRHPPRLGWPLFWLAFAALMVLPLMIEASPLRLATGPMLLAVVAGLILGFGGGRRLRPLLLIPALLVALLLLGLAPPWRVVEADLRTLLDFSGPRVPLVLPTAVAASTSVATATLRAAWAGEPGALNWAVAHCLALIGYVAAGLLGLGLRRRRRLLPWSMPLIGTIAATAITARLGMGYVVLGIFLTLLATIVGDFAGRERAWDRTGVGYSDLLRWDVTQGGALLLIVVLALGFLIPSAPRNTLTTWLWTDVKLPAALAWLDEETGNNDRGPRQVVGRASRGAMRPGDDLELGRSLEQGGAEQVSLTVRVRGLPEGAVPYWRGHLFDRYTGRGWTTGDIRMVSMPPLAVETVATGLVIQEVTDSRPGRRVRYGIPNIIALDAAATLEETELGGAVSWVGTGRDYTVFSSPPAPPPNDPRGQVELQSTLAPYLDVPDDLPPRVVEFTNRLTDGAGSQTERAIAIETYLRGLRYSYEVEPLRSGGDAVDQFLFTMRAGYCTYYASAMAIMARVAGVPSRVAVGYASGAYDPDTGAYIVREEDAHAWPELFIDGQGWTRWEPTPIRPVPPRSTRLERSPSIALVAPEEPVAGAGFIGLLVIGLALFLLLVAAWQRLGFAPPLSPAGVHVDLYRYGRRVGVMSGRGDSVEDYARRLVRVAPAAERPLGRVARLLTARLYRGAPLSFDEERNLVGDWHTVREILRRKPADRL